MIAILTLVNALAPTVANIIVMIRHTNGTQSALIYCDEADVNFSTTEKSVQDWLAAHGKTVAKPA